MKAINKSYLELHFIVMIWGFSAILGELITIPSVELVFYRTLIATLALFGILLYQKKKIIVSKKATLHILLTGTLIALHWILFFAAVKVSKVSICLVGMATCTLWTSILGPVFYRRKMSLIEVSLGIIMILGLYVVFASEFEYAVGLIYAVLSAFLAALFSIINEKLIKKHDARVITFYEMLGATISIALFFTIYVFLFRQPVDLVPTSLDIVYILLLALVCTVYAYSAAVELMKKFSAFALNLTVNLEPVYGIILAFLFFGEKEKMSLAFYLGALVILLSVLSYPTLVKRLQKRKIVQSTKF